MSAGHRPASLYSGDAVECIGVVGPVGVVVVGVEVVVVEVVVAEGYVVVGPAVGLTSGIGLELVLESLRAGKVRFWITNRKV